MNADNMVADTEQPFPMLPPPALPIRAAPQPPQAPQAPEAPQARQGPFPHPMVFPVPFPIYQPPVGYGFPMYHPPQYVPVGMQPMMQPMMHPVMPPMMHPMMPPMAQPVYNEPNYHFVGPYPPYALETLTQAMPDTNAQRAAAAEYPVRAQTPYPPRYLPRNGSGFEYTGMESMTPDQGPQSFMIQAPPSANRATTGSPRERRLTTGQPYESAHSFSYGRQ